MNKSVQRESDEPTAAVATSPSPAETHSQESGHRRRRRRRKRSTPDIPANPRVLLVLGVLLTAAVVLTLLPQSRSLLRVSTLRTLVPSDLVRPEVAALLLAGLVGLFLIPGVEARILAFLGIRRDRSHRSSRRRHR